MRIGPAKYRQYPPGQAFRYWLGEHDAVFPLSILGAVSGLLTGIIVIAFRYAIDGTAMLWLGDHGADGFEQMGGLSRFLLIFLGALVLGLVLQCLPPDRRFTGLNHVLVKFHTRNGDMPASNALVQFFGGIFALATGQSGGREGPAIHMGAASNSILARYLHLPNNTSRILVACGTAAAIGASFNTPIAGVIFAMEVVVLEYTVIGFIPIILAAITATMLAQLAFGNEHVFNIPGMEMASFSELPFLLLLGAACSVAAVIFIRIQAFLQKFRDYPVSLRFALAGLLTASIALVAPEIPGIGYDTVNDVLLGQVALPLLALLCVGKIVTSAVCSGVGMPVGIIGPSLFIGACLGGAMGLMGQQLSPTEASSSGFYALLAMGGMMAALLNAPLAALIAIVELAHTPQAVLPGIIVIVAAALCTDLVFGQRSAVAVVLFRQGISLNKHPVAQALDRIGLSAVIDTNIERIHKELDFSMIDRIAESEPKWLVINSSEDSRWLMHRRDFIPAWERFRSAQVQPTTSASIDEFIDALAEGPDKKLALASLSIQATVREARDLFLQEQVPALYVADEFGSISGILRRDALNKLIDSW